MNFDAMPMVPRSALRFLGTFAGVAVLGLGLVVLPWFDTQVVVPLTRAIAWVVAHAVQMVGGAAVVSNTTIEHASGFAITIVRRCTGLEAIVLLVAAMWAFPARWPQRLLGMVAGSLVLMALNVIRIIALYGIGPTSALWFEWMHYYAGDVLLMIPGLFVFLAWVRWLPSHRTTNRRHAPTA